MAAMGEAEHPSTGTMLPPLRNVLEQDIVDMPSRDVLRNILAGKAVLGVRWHTLPAALPVPNR